MRHSSSGRRPSVCYLVEAATAVLKRPDLPDALCEVPWVSEELLTEARGSAQVRKALLRRYRWDIVRPVLVEQGRRALRLAATKRLPALRCSVVALLSGFGALPHAVLELDAHPSA